MQIFWLIYLFLVNSTCFGRCLRPSLKIDPGGRDTLGFSMVQSHNSLQTVGNFMKCFNESVSLGCREPKLRYQTYKTRTLQGSYSVRNIKAVRMLGTEQVTQKLRIIWLWR